MTLTPGDVAPDFTLSNQFGEAVTLSEFRGVKPVVLVFFPLAFSGTCTGELCELRDNLALFKNEDVELLGISVDNKASLRAWAEQEKYDFDLLSDFWPHGGVAQQYDVFLESKGYANRGTFVIDASGIIRSLFVTAPGEARPFASYTQAIAELRA